MHARAHVWVGAYICVRMYVYVCIGMYVCIYVGR